MKTTNHFWSYLTELFLEWEMFQKKKGCREKWHIVRSVTTFFFFENRAVYEIMWKNVA